MTGFYDQYRALCIGLMALCAVFFGWLLWWGVDHDYFATAHTGYVTSRTFDPAHVVRHDGGSTCWSRDKNGFCTFRTQNPDWYENVPDRWYLELRNCEDYKRCVTGRVWVDETTFNRFGVGSHYPDPR